jgi:hypothetical protein
MYYDIFALIGHFKGSLMIPFSYSVEPRTVIFRALYEFAT